jgi:uncharacterized membrane protein
LIPTFHRQFVHIRGLITVPGAIALGIWLCSVPLLWLDHVYGPKFFALIGDAANLPVETARSLLSTIAAAAMTTLSLVYSMVLVVFTLAAGNIAPRLLKRFTGDRVNQVTAGLLGGTFLFSLTVLYRTGPDFIPVLSIAAAILLACVFVLQLIYFVHAVSRSVTIDEEIASISGRLERRIAAMVRDEQENASDADRPAEFPHAIATLRSGYLNAVDEGALLELACKHDLTIRIRFKPGDFVVETQEVARLSRVPDGDEKDALEHAVRECLLVLPSRNAVDDVEYSINLLIEIALRALSPGINDTFTAIASLDRLSAALSAAVRHGLRKRNLDDADDVVRVELPGLGLEDMFDTAFHPLRRAAASNMLMMEHIAGAFARLHEIGNQKARALISSHAALLLASAKASGPLDADYAALEQKLSFLEPGD